ncbi:chromate transporter [Massilia sp. TWR1-2-2]|uniref:chromate transporter n=1 Tax=Massilia sp. TWR1-2-2 TaxID=2804584 RepID=UPI003CEFE2BA
MDNLLLRLILVFAPLSILSIGGGQAIIADIQHQTVDVYHWLTNEQFADMFAISRATPGPNTLIASLIGWHLGGISGLLVATLAMYVPSSLAFMTATTFWHRSEGGHWRMAIERGLAPIAVGLIFAGALTILQALRLGALGWATTAAAMAVLYTTKANPYLVIFLVIALYLAVFFIA